MPARDAPIASVGEVEIAGARSAVGRGFDVPAGQPGLDEAVRNRLGKIERRLPVGMAAQETAVELTRHVVTDREAARVQARADRGAERLRRDPFLDEVLDRVGGDPGARSAPAAMEQRSSGRVRRHDRDGSAVRGRDGHPGIERPHQKSVRLARSVTRFDEHAAVDLVDPERPALLESGRFAQPAPVLGYRYLVVAHAQAEIQGGVGSAAHTALAASHSEPGARWKGSRAGLPDGNRLRSMMRRLHGAHIALRALAAQAVCAGLLLSGCAHAPAPAGGAEARARFLDLFAAGDSATRGAGMLSIERGAAGRKGLNASWAASADSIAMAAYVGPVRAVDASILGDSLYLAMRRYDLVLAGTLPPEEGLGPRGLLFLARPWTFDAPWIRAALERSAVEPVKGGWRIQGALQGAEGLHPFTLELNSKLDPKRLEIKRAAEGDAWIQIRYGPVRRFQDTRIPQWIEWTKDGTRVRLDIEDHARAKPSQFRHPPAPNAEWEVVALDDPEGRELLRRWFGVGAEEQP